jgi:hypothetical protein
LSKTDKCDMTPLQSYTRIQLKEVEADAVRFLCGPYVRLGEVDKKSTTITVLRTGNFSHPKYGRFQISRELLEGMVRNFDQRTYGQDIQMDVAHKPEDGNAGDIKRLFIEGNRLRATVEWTEYGLKAIRERGFKYISADFANNWIDHELEQEHGPVLFGAALCTRPFVKNMEPVQLSEEGGKTIITFIHPDTFKQFQSEEQNMKKQLDALKKRLQALKLSEKLISKLLSAFENAAKQLAENEEAIQLLYDEFEQAGVQLAEDLGSADPAGNVTIQLGDISVGGVTPDADAINAAVTKQLADAAEAQRLADEQAATALAGLHKIFDDAIDGAEGLSEETVKILNENRDLITPQMTSEQVTKLAESQIAMGHKLEAARQLGEMGYQVPGAAGTVRIQMGDDRSSMQLQETINTHLSRTTFAGQLALTEDKNLNPFARKVLQIFDHLNAQRLHEESKILAGSETNIGDTNFPVGVQRTVIREALSDLRILELVQALTDPTAQATTQIPYEQRDMSAVLNDGVVFEGQGIPGASITQAMDLAYILPRKIAMKLSNEVIHFSRASNINWDAYARNVESNARIMRELIARSIANEYQRAADSYLAADIAAESISGQLGADSFIKTAQFPIVRQHQVYDLQGNAVGSPTNPIVVVLNSVTISPYDGSGTQSAGTYYRVTNYNLGVIQFVDESGAPVSPAATGTNTVSYSYATNIVKFDLDNGTDTTEIHLNGLLQKIGARKAVLQGDRFITPDFLLMSPTLNDTCTNADQFTAAGKRADANVSADGDLITVKGTPAYGTNAPGIDLGDERILIGQRGVCTYTIAKPFMTGTPFEAVNSTGQPTGQKVAYGEEYSAIKVPSPIKNRLTSVIAYSVNARAAI